MDARRLAALVAGIALGAVLLAHRPPSPAAAQTPVESQLLRGKGLYVANCEGCHGADSRGRPPQIQPAVGQSFVARNPNARVVFDVIRSGQEPNLRAMTDQQIYDAIAYELSLNGATPREELTSANALDVPTGAGSPGRNAPGQLFPPPGTP